MSTAVIRRAGVVAAALLVLLVATALPALAHVTLRADNTEPEGFAVYSVRVPNESETGTTTTVEVQLPEGFEASRYRPLPGWDIAIADGVVTIEASGDNPGIAPGEFQEFQFQARNPAEPGDLVFPAIQTYDDGEVASWTGPADADQPAPVVTIGAGGDDGAGGEAATEDDSAAAAGDGDSGRTSALTWVALVLGALGTVIGGLALFRRG